MQNSSPILRWKFLARKGAKFIANFSVLARKGAKFIAKFSATNVTSLPSHSLSLSLSRCISLSHWAHLTHNIGSASALPIIYSVLKSIMTSLWCHQEQSLTYGQSVNSPPELCCLWNPVPLALLGLGVHVKVLQIPTKLYQRGYGQLRIPRFVFDPKQLKISSHAQRLKKNKIFSWGFVYTIGRLRDTNARHHQLHAWNRRENFSSFAASVPDIKMAEQTHCFGLNWHRGVQQKKYNNAGGPIYRRKCGSRNGDIERKRQQLL